MAFVLVGINPRRSLFAALHAALDDGAARARLTQHLVSRHGVKEALVVVAPGRLELYLSLPLGVDGYEAALTAVATQLAPGASLADAGYYAEGVDAVMHLLAAVASLDEFASASVLAGARAGSARGGSRDLGAAGHLAAASDAPDAASASANSMAAALRRARSEAERAGSLGAWLSAVLDAAQCLEGRLGEVARESDGQRLAQTAVVFAGRVFDHLDRRQVLLLGVNGLLGEVAHALAAQGVGGFSFVGPDEAASVARARGARVGSREGAGVLLGAADIVLLAEGLPGLAIDRRLMRTALRARRGRPMLVLDLSSPGAKVVDPRIADMDGVVLYDARDLQALTKSASEGRQAPTLSASAALDEAVRSFTASYDLG
ncbi:MAG: hypothetical protein UCH28_05175 [Adlercreutzia sp.]|nr:hypothetical protein [Adlercreutzia sp.]